MRWETFCQTIDVYEQHYRSQSPHAGNQVVAANRRSPRSRQKMKVQDNLTRVYESMLLSNTAAGEMSCTDCQKEMDELYVILNTLAKARLGWNEIGAEIKRRMQDEWAKGRR